ncbi:MAG: trigger factor [Acetivibrionales bacterium]|jgi:trigger factor|nr:trigger factor [Clostridiaceae bacterium]
MSVKIEKVEKNQVKLEIEVEAKVFDECMNKAFNKNKSRFNIPGFRKGKAPRSMVERYYGEQVLYEDAINYACADAYDNAVDENDIHPVDKPEIDIVQIGSGQNFIFTATVTVKPEVELGEYKGLSVEKEAVVVTEEDIENELKKIVERNSKLVNIEDRPVENGDTLNIDFEGSVDGVPFQGGSAKGYTLVVGSGSFIPGFEEQLVGANLNDEVEVNVTFPEDYHSEDLKGKAAVFKVKINEIKLKQLPEINDEFASDVSEFETLDEYKADIRVKLTEQAQAKADRKYEEDIIKKAVDNSTCDIPEVMVNNRLDDMMRQMDMQLRYQGMNLEGYLNMMGLEIDKFRSDYRDNALEDVKTQLVLEKIAETENIIASPEEYDAELEEMAKRYNQSVEEMKKHLRDDDIEYIKSSIERKKTVEMLVENSKE